MPYNFLFGKSVLPVAPSATGRRRGFLLGAYPSALHVRWTHPELERAIVAIAVDNEPMPFWTGTDEEDRIAIWKESINWLENWGTVSPCGRFNGSSGVWVRDRVLCPLRISAQDIWMTDSLDTYFESDGARERIAQNSLKNLLAKYSIPPPNIERHPSEGEIVTRASAEHQRKRLAEKLTEACPQIVITLGNAALKVIVGQLEGDGVGLPTNLATADRPYGSRYEVASSRFGNLSVIPLAHSGAPDKFQKLHDMWIEEQARIPVWEG